MCKINPRVDFVFKKLFGSEQNKDILISLINAVVSEKDQVKDIVLKNPYNEKNFRTDKQSVLDIKAQDEKGNWFNIEMQIIDQSYYDKRALYYWARLYTGQLSSGINYDNLRKTISINVLNFNCLHEMNYHNTYCLLNVDTHKELLEDLEIHFVELSKFNKNYQEIKTLLDMWTDFLKRADVYDQDKLPAKLAQVATIKKAVTILNTMSLSEEEREIYEARLKWLRDEEMAIKTAENKGFRRGKKQGIEEGKKQGIEEGKKQGIEERNIQVALKMFEQGVDAKIVAVTTGLPNSMLAQLQNTSIDNE